MVRYRTTYESFANRIVIFPPGECWKWSGAINSRGYGNLWDSSKGKNVLVHRYSYELFVGPLNDRYEVDHQCRNRECANPLHLLAGTRKLNQENVGIRHDNTSGYRGVAYHRGTGKWAAEVSHNRKKYWLGLYETAEQAHDVVLKFRLSMYTNNLDDRKLLGE